MFDIVIRNARIVDGTGEPSFFGDVAVTDGIIVAVGGVLDGGRREVDGSGLVLAPGFVDVHTHYDGQATWDADLSPSSWHGVTTVVMGNCGVGFAPARRDGHDFLIELMESVEDIPETALHEGITWGWESFPEYLDVLETTPRTIDILAQVPHAALRAYVLGNRAHEDARPEEVEEMARLVEEALRAGAAGFTSSRTVLHRSKHGLIPGTTAPIDELYAIADAVGRVGGRVYQLISDAQGSGDDCEVLAELAERSGGVVTYTVAQSPFAPEAWREALQFADDQVAEGHDLRPQIACRPTGMLFGLQSTLHPFMSHPTMMEIDSLPLADRVAQLRRPDVRAALLSEEPSTTNFLNRFLISRWNEIFPLGDEPDYEPTSATSIGAVAAATGRDPYDIALDLLLEDDGRSFLFAPLANYVAQDHDAILDMLEHPRSLLGLSDGGAHCGLICDVSFPTYLLTHWVRDRQRGERISLERAIHMQSGQTAESYGLHDRGTIEVGKRADLNLIDLENLTLHAPEMIFDLPGGGRRIVQRASGYMITIQHGRVTFENGVPTGERPGRLVRLNELVSNA
ncbi:MAG: amidohydrolase family protein [Actinomycetota bacterium]